MGIGFNHPRDERDLTSEARTGKCTPPLTNSGNCFRPNVLFLVCKLFSVAFSSRKQKVFAKQKKGMGPHFRWKVFLLLSLVANLGNGILVEKSDPEDGNELKKVSSYFMADEGASLNLHCELRKTVKLSAEQDRKGLKIENDFEWNFAGFDEVKKGSGEEQFWKLIGTEVERKCNVIQDYALSQVENEERILAMPKTDIYLAFLPIWAPD